MSGSGDAQSADLEAGTPPDRKKTSSSSSSTNTSSLREQVKKVMLVSSQQEAVKEAKKWALKEGIKSGFNQVERYLGYLPGVLDVLEKALKKFAWLSYVSGAVGLVTIVVVWGHSCIKLYFLRANRRKTEDAERYHVRIINRKELDHVSTQHKIAERMVEHLEKSQSSISTSEEELRTTEKRFHTAHGKWLEYAPGLYAGISPVSTDTNELKEAKSLYDDLRDRARDLRQKRPSMRETLKAIERQADLGYSTIGWWKRWGKAAVFNTLVMVTGVGLFIWASLVEEKDCQAQSAGEDDSAVEAGIVFAFKLFAPLLTTNLIKESIDGMGRESRRQSEIRVSLYNQLLTEVTADIEACIDSSDESSSTGSSSNRSSSSKSSSSSPSGLDDKLFEDYIDLLNLYIDARQDSLDDSQEGERQNWQTTKSNVKKLVSLEQKSNESPEQHNERRYERVVQELERMVLSRELTFLEASSKVHIATATRKMKIS